MRQAVGVGRLRTSTEKKLRPVGSTSSRPRLGAPLGPAGTKRPSRAASSPSISAAPQASRVGATCSHKPRNTSPLARQAAGGDSPPRQRSIQCNASNSRRSRVSPRVRQAPRPLFQAGRPRALPGLAHVTGQRIEAQAKVVRQALQQPSVGALAIAARNPQQRQQGIQAQSPARRFAEHMQVADLRLLQVAEIGVQLRQPTVRIVAELQADLAVETVVAQEDENLAAQLFGAARVEQRGIVELVGQALQVAQRAVALGAGQRRHQVVDDHRLGAALGLGASPGR